VLTSGVSNYDGLTANARLNSGSGLGNTVVSELFGLNFQFYNLLNHADFANASGPVSGRLIVIGAKITF